MSNNFSSQKSKSKAQVGKEEAESSNLPKTFVMHRGDVGKSIIQLEMDVRHVMEPHTAIHLKVNMLFVYTKHFILDVFKLELLHYTPILRGLLGFGNME